MSLLYFITYLHKECKNNLTISTLKVYGQFNHIMKFFLFFFFWEAIWIPFYSTPNPHPLKKTSPGSIVKGHYKDWIPLCEPVNVSLDIFEDIRILFFSTSSWKRITYTVRLGLFIYLFFFYKLFVHIEMRHGWRNFVFPGGSGGPRNHFN